VVVDWIAQRIGLDSQQWIGSAIAVETGASADKLENVSWLKDKGN
jgi:hypothetical protein